MLELRAAVSLSRLWKEQGKAEDGRRLLSDAYERLTEGFTTADMKEASALLADFFISPDSANGNRGVSGSGDDRSDRSTKGRTSRRALRLPKRLLPAQPDYAGRQTRVESSPGPQRTVFHRDISNAISAARRRCCRVGVPFNSSL